MSRSRATSTWTCALRPCTLRRLMTSTRHGRYPRGARLVAPVIVPIAPEYFSLCRVPGLSHQKGGQPPGDEAAGDEQGHRD